MEDLVEDDSDNDSNRNVRRPQLAVSCLIWPVSHACLTVTAPACVFVHLLGDLVQDDSDNDSNRNISWQ